jgi:hypothetical protein
MYFMLILTGGLVQGTTTPSHSLDELAALLRKSEVPPTNERGEVTNDFAKFAPQAAPPSHVTCRYVVDGERAVVYTDYANDRGERQSMVQGRNGRLEFWLNHYPGGWAFERYSHRPGGISKHIEGFFTYFSDTYSIQNHRLSELILRPDYQVRVSREGEHEYKLFGTRSDRDSPGLLDFTATVRIARSYPYAYAVATSYEMTEPDRRDHDEMENTVREDPDGPRLTASVKRHVATVGGVVHRYESRTAFRFERGVPAEAQKEFELSHYGLNQPPELPFEGLATGPEPEHDRSQFYWLISALVAGVTLFLVGRYLLGSKRPTAIDPGHLAHPQNQNS